MINRRERDEGSLSFERRGVGLGERDAVAQKEDPVAPALTRRERRVKDILLKELAKLSDVRQLTYAEKQHLEKGLDVPFIDRELGKMRNQLRRVRRLGLPVSLVFGGLGLFLLVGLVMGLPWADSIGRLFTIGIAPIAAFTHIRALRRKIFIYEALRELSDADEIDVVLDRAVREADLLISRIVDKELEAEAHYPLHLAGQRFRN